ncbi:GntR family transcriptional regulator [Paenibacillus radicis (ex Xue et al. 2023)]|uniref:GntR family transcriptional regulator n=1 Tax=Paenibacillus radicis (ex Xue et al. 2023) TaxID=2972489 RepID=A0ABT1YR15_9BACL|nr:GntR family transcriptional regulator [Paenibacillus radicis (ex Xue et al. 2023)]MCR8635617.1 GntR family transcriptional regulator [Paenibacillus radicis (ex Xue et al. 2023)]
MKKKLSKYVLTDEIYKIIKEQILSHELAPGEKVNIDKLARDLEVSNIPIREALSRLSSEGFVDMIPYKGMFVTPMSLKDLNELFELRIHLETLAVEKAAALIPEQELLHIKEKMDSFAKVKPASDSEFLQYVFEMNEILHGVILQYCGNDMLQNVVSGYIERIQSYLVFLQKNMNIDHSQLEWEEHAQILHQLIQRNVQEASRALRFHLQNSLERTKVYFH